MKSKILTGPSGWFAVALAFVASTLACVKRVAVETVSFALAASSSFNSPVAGWANGSTIPGKEDFRQYQVTSDRESEVIRQTLYDSLLYPAAGQTEFVFFSEGQGSGITSTPGNAVGSRKILSDTNASVNGMLPNGMAYMCESLECFFWPGSVSTANTFTLGKYTTDATGVLLANAISGINDKKLVYETGQLVFTVLQKPQLQETPLGVFPPKTWMEVDSALATTTTTTSLAIANARPGGRAYYLDPPIAIAPTVSFNVKVLYPAVQALPSTFNGRMMMKFDGYLNRAAQ